MTIPHHQPHKHLAMTHPTTLPTFQSYYITTPHTNQTKHASARAITYSLSNTDRLWFAIPMMLIRDLMQLPGITPLLTQTKPNMQASVLSLTSCATYNVVSDTTDLHLRFNAAPRNHVTTLTNQSKNMHTSALSRTSCATHKLFLHTTDVHSPFTQAPQNNANPHTNPNKHALFCAAPTTH